ncbi:hypothetical protein [Sulfolobus spindle-shaped virus]|nr:hypothetical protein [Sulfolobus spindle-shaped virus]
MTETTQIELYPNKIILVSYSGNKLTIEIEIQKNKVIATYADMILIINYVTFDTLYLAKRIFPIVKQSKHFSITGIKNALDEWAKKYYTDGLIDSIIKKLEKMKKNGKIDYEKLRKIDELLGDGVE